MFSGEWTVVFPQELGKEIGDWIRLLVLPNLSAFHRG